MIISGLSHPGNFLSTNEDTLKFNQTLSFAVVADGIGGNRGGKNASSTAATTIHDIINSCLGDEQGTIPFPLDPNKPIESEILKNAVRIANDAIIRELKGISSLGLAGTSLCALIHKDETATFCNVGNCRLYLLRKGILKRLSEGQHLGKYKGVENLSPEKNTTLRYLGMMKSVPVEVKSMKTRKDDLFLLATKGLVNALHSDKIYNIIEDSYNNEKGLFEQSKKLVYEANQQNYCENITLALCKVN